ncbi:histidine phosphatase family protein [Pseudoxanthomonas beigongshangi]
MIVDLVRHASTGRAGHFDGRTDPPLLPGAADAICGGCAGMAWSRVISSPRQRALHTAQALAAPQALPVAIDVDWAEWDFGDWDGQHRDAIAVDDASRHALQAFYQDPGANPPPNAEPWDAFEARIGRGLRALAAQDDAAPALVVSHAGPLRLALALACGLPLASSWAVRIDYGTRLRLRVQTDAADRLWGELIEVRQA